MERTELTDTLRGSTVGIAGAGGLGSNIAIMLARAGVGRLIVVDFDLVERSNLDRQAYYSDQIGMPKINALRDNIERIDPEIEFTAVEMMLESGSMIEPFSEADVVVEALDLAELKAYLIEEVLIGLDGVPIVAASGVGGMDGTDRVAVRRTGNLYLVEDPEGLSCEVTMMISTKVNLFASLQAHTVLEILTGGGHDDHC